MTVELHDGFVKFRTGNKEMKLQKASDESMWTIMSRIIPCAEAMVIDGKIEPEKDKTKKAIPQKVISKMNVMEAHEKLDYSSEKTTRMTLESFGWGATGEMEPYDACMRHNAKAKAVSHKPTATKADKPGERQFMDTTGPSLNQNL